MLRQTCVLAAAEFKQKSRWSGVWPNMHYGAMYLRYSVGRQMPMQGVNWVTRDSNRLLNFSARYQTVIDDLDVKRNEEELQIPLTEIRWNDHRRVYWKCSFCGASYRKSVSVRTKFHAGCKLCRHRHASEVLKEQTAVTPLQSAQPALYNTLAVGDKKENIGSLGVTSKFPADWTCSCCGKAYRASIRSRTGLVEEGHAPLHPQIAQWTSVCPSCAWAANMKAVAEHTKSAGDFLGLDASMADAVAAAAKKIPRRRKLVA